MILFLCKTKNIKWQLICHLGTNIRWEMNKFEFIFVWPITFDKRKFVHPYFRHWELWILQSQKKTLKKMLDYENVKTKLLLQSAWKNLVIGNVVKTKIFCWFKLWNYQNKINIFRWHKAHWKINLSNLD